MTRHILKTAKCILFFAFFLSTVNCQLSTAFAQGLSSAELINNAKEYDGKTIVYEGEVIGDIMMRGSHAWVNVNDGVNAIGVWIEAGLAKDISYTGSYKYKGDQVEVAGLFHRVCPEHGGDLDIHASSLKIIASGRIINEKISQGKKNILFVLGGALAILWTLTLLKRR